MKFNIPRNFPGGIDIEYSCSSPDEQYYESLFFHLNYYHSVVFFQYGREKQDSDWDFYKEVEKVFVATTHNQPGNKIAVAQIVSGGLKILEEFEYSYKKDYLFQLLDAAKRFIESSSGDFSDPSCLYDPSLIRTDIPHEIKVVCLGKVSP